MEFNPNIPAWLQGDDLADIRGKLSRSETLDPTEQLEVGKHIVQSETGLPMGLVDFLVCCRPGANYAVGKTTQYLANYPSLADLLKSSQPSSSAPTSSAGSSSVAPPSLGLENIESKPLTFETERYVTAWPAISLCIEAMRHGINAGTLPSNVLALAANRTEVNGIVTKFGKEESIESDVKATTNYYVIANVLKRILADTFPPEEGTNDLFLALAEVGGAADKDQAFTNLQAQLAQVSPDRRAILGEMVRFGHDLVNKAGVSAEKITSMLQPSLFSHTDPKTEHTHVKDVQKAIQIMIERHEELWPA